MVVKVLQQSHSRGCSQNYVSSLPFYALFKFLNQIGFTRDFVNSIVFFGKKFNYFWISFIIQIFHFWYNTVAFASIELFDNQRIASSSTKTGFPCVHVHTCATWTGIKYNCKLSFYKRSLSNLIKRYYRKYFFYIYIIRYFWYVG